MKTYMITMTPQDFQLVLKALRSAQKQNDEFHVDYRRLVELFVAAKK